MRGIVAEFRKTSKSFPIDDCCWLLVHTFSYWYTPSFRLLLPLSMLQHISIDYQKGNLRTSYVGIIFMLCKIFQNLWWGNLKYSRFSHIVYVWNSFIKTCVLQVHHPWSLLTWWHSLSYWPYCKQAKTFSALISIANANHLHKGKSSLWKPIKRKGKDHNRVEPS